jgi:transposase-like protein
MGIFTPGISKVAYRGKLTCPVCQSGAIRFVEQLGPYRLRYRCRKCGLPFQYETGNDMGTHPYAPFNKNKFVDIVDEWGRKLKENHNG